MFFNEEELKVAEELAWNMLDGWNHAYMPDLVNYAHFYYKGQVILDPWMNEKSQGLPWPDHKSKESAVNPVEYYGQKRIEDYVVKLFMLRPEWNPEITERIKCNLNKNGKLNRYSATIPVDGYIAMPDEQTSEGKVPVCIEWELPDSQRIFFDMLKLPAELVHVVKHRRKREVIFLKRDAQRIFEILYPDGTSFDYKEILNRINGTEVRLIGRGD